MTTPKETRERIRAELGKLRERPVDRNGHPLPPPAPAAAPAAEDELQAARDELAAARAALAEQNGETA